MSRLSKERIREELVDYTAVCYHPNNRDDFMKRITNVQFSHEQILDLAAGLILAYDQLPQGQRYLSLDTLERQLEHINSEDQAEEVFDLGEGSHLQITRRLPDLLSYEGFKEKRNFQPYAISEIHWVSIADYVA